MVTTLHLATGPRLIPDLSPAFAAPPELAEVLSVSPAAEPLFFDQPLPRILMRYRTRTGPGVMLSPLRAVSVLAGKVIVKVLEKWIVGEVRSG